MLELLMGFGIKGNGGDSDELIAGDLTKGYYGEVTSDTFINGNDLATQIGLTAGTAFNSDAGWLKFSLDYKTLYVAKRPFKYGISWNSINAIGAVKGTSNITINGKLFLVRLLKGRSVAGRGSGYDLANTHNSEWNRLMYHVSVSPNRGNATSEGISVGDWAQFSNTELGILKGNGGATWTQDLNSGYATSRVYDNASVAYVTDDLPTSAIAFYGWRPCLELVE
jgi:hypothetical protein